MTEQNDDGSLGTTASDGEQRPPSTSSNGRLRALAKDIDFAIDVTEPQEVRLQRFVEILREAGVED